MENEATVSKNFIEQIIEKDLAEGHCKTVKTRFPPEPNGYLHIGHAKSILLNYGLAKKYDGQFNLRFDDTNPTKERLEFVESIEADVKWLGADWADKKFFASNYFDKMYECAVGLIKKGKAYVSDLTPDEIREYRGTLTEAGKEDPYSKRSVEENLDLFERMKNGEFEDGTKVLRARIDMSSSNINMRDPILYRVAHMTHHNTGDKWCVYPMYDFAHPIEDAIEGITHSICTLEFEDHRPLYDWVVIECGFKNSPEESPKQIEFAKLYLTNVVTGKRYIKRLVEDGIVDGWDDPRLVSIAALRRRGFTPESIQNFVDLCGISKANSSVDYAMLEYCIREDLKAKRPRMMAVLDPVKVIIDNYPEGQVEYLEVDNNVENPELGKRKVPFTRELYVERDDFMEEPPKKYFRMFPGNEVRFMNAYFVKCNSCIKDENRKQSGFSLAMGAFSILCPRYSLRRRHERCSHSIQTHGHVEYRYRPLYQWFESSLGDKAIVEPFGRSAENQTLVDRSHANPGRCRIGRNRLDDPRPPGFHVVAGIQFGHSRYCCRRILYVRVK